MSSRFPRDRSPPRYGGDRRAPQHGPGGRGPEDANSIPLGREPPRGPKALESTRGPYFGPSGARSRGGRGGDFRERDRERGGGDPRDSRDGPPPFRREQDWARRERGFESRDGRPPAFGRGRSRSPPPLRDFRETEGVPPRARRNSRDGPPGPGAPPLPDAPPPSFRGGHHGRGRGRGDLDRERGRGRGAPVDDRDRDLFRRRSRSREPWRDREVERRERFDRREDDRRSDRDERERPPLERVDSWKDSKPMPPPPSSVAPQPSSVPAPPNTISSKDSGDESRKLVPPPFSAVKDSRRPPERQEPPPPPFQGENPTDRPLQPASSPPPSGPEVPAFGSISKLIQDQPEQPPIPTGPSAETGRRASLSVAKPPPTAPKADREQEDFRPNRPPDPTRQSKHELSIRPNKPPAAAMSSESPNPDSRPQRPVTPDASFQIGPTWSRPPTGPRPRSSGSPTGPPQPFVRTPASSSGRGGSPPQQANRPPTSPGISFASVPTGPRAFQRSGPPRGGAKASNQWVRPGYSNNHGSPPTGPNSTSPAHRRGSREDISLNRPASSEHLLPAEKDEPHKPSAEERPEPEVKHSGAKRLIDAQLPAGERQSRGELEDEEEEAPVPFLYGESSGQETDEEDDLDEEDFNQGEHRFEKEMQSLAAEIPPPLLQDPIIVGLLLKIQMLGMIASGAVPTSLDLAGAAMEIEGTHGPSSIIPLPGKEAKEIELSDAAASFGGDSAPTAEAAAEIPTVEKLPFLHSGPPTPFSEMESLQETLKAHDRVKDALREELTKQRTETTARNERLRDEYAQRYKPWRRAIAHIDRKNEESKPEIQAPPTPPPPVVVPAPEGRRGYRLNSELDFQNALKASAITAQEELARRKDKEASAKPDMSREVPIPDMLDPSAQKTAIFQDTNQIVHVADAERVFGFYPPPNDFTPAEHKTFTDAFMAHPKKWGKIAESLPGRTFQQCVTHYYLTKEEIKYKAKLNKRWTTKRGRGRKAVRPAKTNALMADLGAARAEYDTANGTGVAGEDPDATPAVTDSGRPRRAAAPTFGESNAEIESGGATPNGAKRGNGGSTGNSNSLGRDANGEGIERPATAGRRGGRGGGRGGRRQKAQAQVQALSQQQQQSTAAITPIAAAPPKQGAEFAPDGYGSVMVKDKEDSENVLQSLEGPIGAAPAAAAPRTKGGSRGSRQKESSQSIDASAGGDGMAIKDSTATSEVGGYGSLQPTSYWSVQEQRDFPDLVSHYGKDFEAISQFMKTKTATMVKNYFQRKIDSGKTQLEELALIAEAKKSRGEPTGPLPTPSVMSKRRYEATPSAVGPRPLAPNTEATEQVDRSLAPKNKPGAPGPALVAAGAPPPTTASTSPHARQQVVKDRGYPLLAQATGAPGYPSMLSDENQPPSMNAQVAQSGHRVQHGPRIGYFSDDRRPMLNPSNQVLQEPIESRQQHPQHAQVPQAGQGMSGIPHQSHVPGQEPGRRGIVSRPPETQESLRYPMQSGYLQPRPPSVPAAGSSPGGHSRRTSRNLSSAATSPIQKQPPVKLDPDQGRPDLLAKPRSEYLHSSSHLSGDVGSRHTGLAPPVSGREPPRSSSTPAHEPPRQVPAKRSNIMSILNDEPEAPEPRKRFASDYAVSSSSRPPVYSSSQQGHGDGPGPAVPQQQQGRGPYGSTGVHPSPQVQHHQLHHHHHQQPVESVRQYPEQQPGYGSSGTPAPASQDWLARFDPRGQQQSSQQPSSQLPRLSTQQPSTNHSYTSPVSRPPQPGVQQSQQQPQPQSSQRPAVQHHTLQQQQQQQQQSRQPPSLHTQGHQPHSSIGSATRESPISQQQMYHQGAGSPAQRHHSISYPLRAQLQDSGSPVQTPPVPGSSHARHQHQHSGQLGGYGHDNQQQHHLPNQPSSYGQSTHHRRSPSVGLTPQQQQPPHNPPFRHNTPPTPSHVQAMSRHQLPPSGNSRSYTPPQQTPLQHSQSHSQGGGGIAYSDGQPPASQNHGAGQHPNTAPAHPIQIQPRQSGPGRHHGYPPDSGR